MKGKNQDNKSKKKMLLISHAHLIMKVHLLRFFVLLLSFLDGDRKQASPAVGLAEHA